MRTITIPALVLIALAGVSCSKRPTSQLSPITGGETTGRVEVYVSWDAKPLADRQLEIVELGLKQTSNADGLARFDVPPGTYTLRSWVSSPGPAAYVDSRVSIEPGETESVKVLDCLPCL